jgi:hypothetical protein
MSANHADRSGRHDPDHINLAGTIAELLLICAAAILFNFFPQYVGFVRSATDLTTFTPLLGPGFAAFLPWLNTYWLWAFCLCLAHLTLHRWTLGTRLIDLGLDLFGAAIFAALCAGSPFLEVPVATFAARSALFFVCIAFLLGATDQFVRLLKWKPRAGRSGEAGSNMI